ncbi:MAG: DUF6531 domain-containing protein, partial [Actinomycetota bacterium]|nr:DUF6531 domain-containing protein [Actinomycetota bacterium]
MSSARVWPSTSLNALAGRLTVLTLAASLLTAAPLASPAVASTPTTTQVSLTVSGGQPNDNSAARDITPDGRVVLFKSSASNLLGTSQSVGEQLYLRDMDTGAVERVSLNSTGEAANAAVAEGAVSADGRFAAFATAASNVVEGDGNGYSDIFVRDGSTGETQRVSVSSSGTEGDKASTSPSISADGRYVAFRSYATNLVPGDTNGTSDIFVHDGTTAQTSRVSVTSAGGQAELGHSYAPDLSASGQFVAFYSDASNLGGGLYEDVFVHDRNTGVTELISVPDAASGAAGRGLWPSISSDGRFVAYVDGGHGNTFNVYRRDRHTGVILLTSINSGGAPVAGSHKEPRISGDGRAVAFESDAALVAADANAYVDVYLRDFAANSIELVAVNSAGNQGSSWSQKGLVSYDSRYVAFTTGSALVPSDTCCYDVYRRDRGEQLPWVPAEQTFGLVMASSRHGVNPSGWQSDPVNSATGSYTTAATDLALPGVGDEFVMRRVYNSADTAATDLGQGWSHTLAPSLSF